MPGAVAERTSTPTTPPATLAIVMPVLNEAPRLAAALQALQPLRTRGVQLIVVDGGSSDDSVAVAQSGADTVLSAPRGRGAQMNVGALASTAELLIFLHADTQLPDQADALVRRALRPRRAAWGRFDVHIDSAVSLLRVVGWAMNLRSRWTGIATGDQAIFVKREVFVQLGGFADQPLMEDIDLCTRLKQHSPPVCLSQQVITSGRRWERHGPWRTIWLMWRLRAAYFFGADPAQLAIDYGYAPPTPPAPR
jgi:rSAM/selenodomain-associated transferase 2